MSKRVSGVRKIGPGVVWVRHSVHDSEIKYIPILGQYFSGFTYFKILGSLEENKIQITGISGVRF